MCHSLYINNTSLKSLLKKKKGKNRARLSAQRSFFCHTFMCEQWELQFFLVFVCIITWISPSGFLTHIKIKSQKLSDVILKRKKNDGAVLLKNMIAVLFKTTDYNCV